MKKVKVSFDIEEENLSDIRKYCETNNFKLSDFFRASAIEKLKRDKDYIVIFVPREGKIEKYVVNKMNFEIDMHDASHDMQINADAKKEGIIRLKNDIEIDEPIFNLIKKSSEGKIAFFCR